MLTATVNMTADEFIAQLRVFAVAFGCSPLVIDKIDNLADLDTLEDVHEEEIEKAEQAAREETYDAILKNVVEQFPEASWLKDVVCAIEEVSPHE